jgi:hypothetical protein
MAMAPKNRGVASVDPFKKVTNMNPQQFITDNTNASQNDPISSRPGDLAR